MATCFGEVKAQIEETSAVLKYNRIKVMGQKCIILKMESNLYRGCETNNSLDDFLPFAVKENEIIPYTCQFHSFQQHIE